MRQIYKTRQPQRRTSRRHDSDIATIATTMAPAPSGSSDVEDLLAAIEALLDQSSA